MEFYATDQRKNDKKIKRRDKNSDSDCEYLQSFKNVALKPKRSKIGISKMVIKSQCVFL
jgi:hypothetical protein